MREVLKRLNTPSFQAAYALLGAVGRLDPTTTAPQGLMAVRGAGRVTSPLLRRRAPGAGL